MVRTVVEILGVLKNEAAVKPLTTLIRHADFRVRREALAALAQLGRGRALDALHGALMDPDPRIRMAAARGLASTGRRALPALLAVIDHPGFDQRDLVEKRTFYEALGFAGKTEVLPVIRQALHRKGLLRRGNAEEVRACACEALGWIGGQEAKMLLNEAVHDKSVLVRTAAQSALRRIASQANVEFTIKEAA
jgi:HEAT repeat protein